MSSTDPNIHPHWAAETKELAAELDKMDYYQVLGCPPDAPLSAIKEKYHALQRAYHPDTFYQSPDTELKEAVFRIAKRVAEAYVILRDPARREKYTRDVQSAERAKKLRYTEETEREHKIEKEQVLGKTPQGRKLVQQALGAMKKNEWAAAVRDLKTAMIFEKDNELIKAKLAEAQEKLGPVTPAKKKP